MRSLTDVRHWLGDTLFITDHIYGWRCVHVWSTGTRISCYRRNAVTTDCRKPPDASLQVYVTVARHYMQSRE